jgi:hypothetical protein
MSAFTDEDLKRLKDMCKAEGTGSLRTFYRHEIQALLARLEAAEKVFHSGEDCLPSCAVFDRGNYCDCGVEAWRKQAGKS